MIDTITFFIWISFFVIGLILGGMYYYKRYSKMVLDVLDNLLYTEKISKTEYDYYKEKFIKQKDALKSIKEIAIKLKREEKE